MSDPQQIDLFSFNNGVSPTEPTQPHRATTQHPSPVIPVADPIDPKQIPTSAKIPIPAGTYNTMEDLVEPCGQCQRCDLGRTRTHAVIGRGNPQARIMIIGEGPGQNEDEQGLPFVGKAGQLLDKILEAVEFQTDRDVYICNAVKCRPPGNRKPLPEELAACRPYLSEQIRIMNPQIILLMGATAVQTLLEDKTGITKLRGQWRTWQDAQGIDRLCMPLFHPSYLLRNASRAVGSPKWQTWQDIQTVRSKWESLGEPSTK